MPTRGLLDTNIVVHMAALRPDELPDEMVISAVTLVELSAGPHHAPDPVERARRMSVLQHVEATFDPLSFDADAVGRSDWCRRPCSPPGECPAAGSPT